MTGVDAMATKEAKNCMISENYKKHKLRETDPTSWKTDSRQAPLSDQKCSMTITIFLGLDNHFYLSKKSCLNHCHHLHQKSEYIIHGQKVMDTGDIYLLTLLCSVNVSPMQILQIMEQVKVLRQEHIPQSVSMMSIREQRISKKLLLVSYPKVTML